MRKAEVLESCKIIEQALDSIPEGPTNVDPEGHIIDPDLMADLGKFGRQMDG